MKKETVMKKIIVAALIIISSSVYADSGSRILSEADSLISQKKYNSAFMLLLKNDNDKKDSDVVLKELDLLLNYFAQSIMHEMFGLADIRPDQDIMDVRGKPGSWDMYSFPAEKILADLIKTDPRNGKLYYALANYYYDVSVRYRDNWKIGYDELLDRAEINFLKAKELKTADYFSLYVLGEISLHRNNGKKAIAFLSESMKLKPDNANTVYNLAYAYYLGGDYASSLKLSLKAYDIYTDKVYKTDSAQIAANSCMRMKDYQKAVTYFTKGLDLTPDNFYLHNGLLRTFLLMKKIDSADKEADAMFAMHPTYPNMTQSISDNYTQTGNSAGLERFFERNIGSYRDSEVLGNLYFYQGKHYLETKHPDRARESLLKAKDCFVKVFKPDHPVFKAIDSSLSEM
jgi:tetratricopeptide (TPR) repeat protein